MNNSFFFITKKKKLKQFNKFIPLKYELTLAFISLLFCFANCFYFIIILDEINK